MPDCGSQPCGTSPALGWSVIAVKLSGRGSRQGVDMAGLLKEICHYKLQNIIFDVMSEVQKYLEDISAGTGIFYKSDSEEFCLESDIKVGEVNLTSPSIIRVNEPAKVF
jgi:hypothetical protein